MSSEDALSEGKYGDFRINPDALENSFEQLDDDGNLKAKVWESDDGDQRLYLRIRDHDDGRRFNEYSVNLAEAEPEEREPLDLTIQEVASICGDGTFRDEVAYEDLPDHRSPAGHVAAAFEDVHPAVAGVLIRRIAEGLDDGYTAQGAAHPDFQRVLRQVVRDE